MASCEFDKLFKKSVPHVLEKIFLSLNYKSYKNCMQVCRSWNDLLTSEPFQRMGKSIFCEDIHEELRQAAVEGNKDGVSRILSSGMVDANNLTPWGILYQGARCGHKDVVQLLLDRGAEPNMADQNGMTPLHYAAFKGHKDVVQLLLERGAEQNMAAQKGFTPLHLAAFGAHKDVV